MGFSEKIKGNRKTAIAIAVLLAVIIVAFFAFFFSRAPENGPEKEDAGTVSVTATADNMHMERKLTAAGKVTTGKKDTISLVKGKTLKAVCVSKNEGVKKGYALAYYTDGTHTDAPSDGIVTGIHTPQNGETVTASHSIKFSNTKELYLKVTVPENEINNVSKGDTAQIVINAKPHEQFLGEIVEKKDVSTTMIKEIKNERQSQKEESDLEERKSNDKDENGAEENEEEESDPGDEENAGSEEDEEESSEEAESEDDNGTVYYSVNIRFSNDSTLRPGMSASCIITVLNRDDVLAVPIEAVYFDDEGKPFVYRENGKEKETAYVKLGSSDAMNVEIKSGLKKGDKIKYDKH